MKKTSKPTPKIPARQAPATKQPAAKLKATAKPSTSTFMEKASKSGSAPKPASTRLATNPSAAKPKAMAKSSTKPKPRVAEGQAELIQVVAQLTMSAEKLAQAVDRLTEATLQKAQASERHDETLKTPEAPEEEATDLAASHQEMVDAPDLIAPEGINATDSKALEEYPGTPEPSEDE